MTFDIIQIVFVSCSVLSTIVLIRQILVWTKLVQVKEYRRDRLSEFISSPEGRRFAFSYHLYTSLALSFLSIIFLLFPTRDTFILIGVTQIIAWTGFTGIFIREMKDRGVSAPILTIKSVMLLITIVLLILVALYGLTHVNISLYQQIWSFPFFHVVISLIVLMAVLILRPLDLFLKKRLIRLAKKRRTEFPNLKVIGVTGSFGKTSVKTFLGKILSEHFMTIVTPEHLNSEIGIAKMILNNLNKDYEIMIVEMGAYRKDEIKLICDIVKPHIGIITGVDEQHVALFGSIERTAKAKAELMEAIAEDNLMILEADNKYTARMAKEYAATHSILTYGETANSDARISNIETDPNNLTFNLELNNSSYILCSQVAGKHNAHNLTAAFLAARELGVPEGQIIDAISKIKPLSGTLAPINTKQGIILIDDSYNANPSGVENAIDYLNRNYPKNHRIVVLDDIIELGSSAPSVYKRLAKKLADIDQIIYVGKSYFDLLKASSADISPQHVSHMTAHTLLQKIPTNTVILFEGRLAKDAMKKLKKKWQK